MYNLLIADDEPIIRRGIRTLIDFEALSIGKIFEAENGVKALEILRSEKIDILLTDVNMAGMDGLALAKLAKELNRDMKVVIITGYHYFDYAVTAIKAGVDDFVLKPVSKADITEILVKLVSSIRQDQQKKDAISSMDAIKKLSGAGEEITYKNDLLKVIDENYGDSTFSLPVLAKEMNLSAGYVSNVFKKVFGIPFHDYLVTLRLEKAKIFLLTTQLKSYEVANRVGFEDPNYFSTCFKRKYGTSPTRYKEMVVGGYDEDSRTV